MIPVKAYQAKTWLLPLAGFAVLSEALKYVWVNALAFVLLLVVSKTESVFWAPKRKLLAEAVICALPVGYSYAILSRYPPFAEYPPFLAGFFCLWGGLLLLSWWMRRPSKAPSSRFQVLLRGAAPLAFAALALIFESNNNSGQRGLYPTLHLTLLLLTHLSLSLFVWTLWMVTPLTSRFAKCLRVWGQLSIALVLLAPALSFAGVLDRSLPYVIGFTASGKARAVFSHFESAELEHRPALRNDPEASRRFAQRSNLPGLPTDFDLQNFNVLLITSEATRFDRTSLKPGSVGRTPNLVSLEDRGAFVFENAYSPSSGTLHSISSLLSMRIPSMVPLETYMRPWHGELLPEVTTVPELFKNSGYSTFWTSHGHNDCFRHHMLGFGQGFDHEEFVVELVKPASPKMDAEIADAAIRELRRQAKKREKFFGWIFFGAPHGSYLTHYPEMPAESAHDRYLQELRYTDEQLGRVLDTLKSLGQIENTILIFMGDHGEEFLEHGAKFHKATLYREVVNVPLVVRIPGIEGRRVTASVSTMYVFPWLLERGSKLMQAEVHERLTTEIGPMLRETDGAVIIELLGHERMTASLVSGYHKIHYDFLSGHREIYDLTQDPYEQDDLVETHSELAQKSLRMTESYKNVRAARAQFILRSDYDL